MNKGGFPGAWAGARGYLSAPRARICSGRARASHAFSLPAPRNARERAHNLLHTIEDDYFNDYPERRGLWGARRALRSPNVGRRRRPL
jgi:hypothetical protein